MSQFKKKTQGKLDIKAVALSLSDLVQYQEGAIVSRAVIQKKTGSVTLFAFGQGQQLSEHTVPFDALVCGLDGRGEVTISGRPHELSQGQMIIMPAREPHAVKALEKFKMMLVMIRS